LALGSWFLVLKFKKMKHPFLFLLLVLFPVILFTPNNSKPLTSDEYPNSEIVKPGTADLIE